MCDNHCKHVILNKTDINWNLTEINLFFTSPLFITQHDGGVEIE